MNKKDVEKLPPNFQIILKSENKSTKDCTSCKYTEEGLYYCKKYNKFIGSYRENIDTFCNSYKNRNHESFLRLQELKSKLSNFISKKQESKAKVDDKKVCKVCKHYTFSDKGICWNCGTPYGQETIPKIERDIKIIDKKEIIPKTEKEKAREKEIKNDFLFGLFLLFGVLGVLLMCFEITFYVGLVICAILGILVIIISFNEELTNSHTNRSVIPEKKSIPHRLINNETKLCGKCHKKKDLLYKSLIRTDIMICVNCMEKELNELKKAEEIQKEREQFMNKNNKIFEECKVHDDLIKSMKDYDKLYNDWGKI